MNTQNVYTPSTYPPEQTPALRSPFKGERLQFKYSTMNLSFLFYLATMQMHKRNSIRLMGKRSPERVLRGQNKRRKLGRVPYFPSI